MLKTSLYYIRNMFWYIWNTFGKIENFRFLDVWSAATDGWARTDGQTRRGQTSRIHGRDLEIAFKSRKITK